MSLECEGLGGACDYADCGVFDFLPILCRGCGGKYCSNHASLESHECIGREDGTVSPPPPGPDEADVVAPGETKRPKRCEMDDCTAHEAEEAPIHIVCPACNAQYCLAHRVPESHACVAAMMKIARTVATTAPRDAEKGIDAATKRSNRIRVGKFRLSGSSTRATVFFLPFDGDAKSDSLGSLVQSRKPVFVSLSNACSVGNLLDCFFALLSITPSRGHTVTVFHAQESPGSSDKRRGFNSMVVVPPSTVVNASSLDHDDILFVGALSLMPGYEPDSKEPVVSFDIPEDYQKEVNAHTKLKPVSGGTTAGDGSSRAAAFLARQEQLKRESEETPAQLAEAKQAEVEANRECAPVLERVSSTYPSIAELTFMNTKVSPITLRGSPPVPAKSKAVVAVVFRVAEAPAMMPFYTVVDNTHSAGRFVDRCVAHFPNDLKVVSDPTVPRFEVIHLKTLKLIPLGAPLGVVSGDALLVQRGEAISADVADEVHRYMHPDKDFEKIAKIKMMKECVVC